MVCLKTLRIALFAPVAVFMDLVGFTVRLFGVDAGDAWYFTTQLFKHELYYLWEEHKWYRAFRRHNLPWEYDVLYTITDSHGNEHQWGRYGPFYFAPAEETRYDASYGRPIRYHLRTPGWHEVSWTGFQNLVPCLTGNLVPCLTGFVPSLPYLVDDYFEGNLAYYNRDFEIIRYVFRGYQQ